ncbi:MAG: hypothetical protein ABSG01_08635 [Anaerolineales bacterium]
MHARLLYLRQPYTALVTHEISPVNAGTRLLRGNDWGSYNLGHNFCLVTFRIYNPGRGSRLIPVGQALERSNRFVTCWF